MSIDILYPEQGSVDDAVIEKWFVEAVHLSMVEPRYLNAKTVLQMAEVLESVGILIIDRSKPPLTSQQSL